MRTRTRAQDKVLLLACAGAPTRREFSTTAAESSRSSRCRSVAEGERVLFAATESY